ncbi:acyl-coenzyme A:6-aminopenicillanic acid acyl-transferase-domain-containing protein [Xylariaceae sp. FL0662B]|nr:acyl-coenzyme A:6-aminopenicillanic acid acyl-transferase-domain-containing protein [Xylariaceae sp. FL0662B]
MLDIRCSGTPHEIGVTHGVLAKEKIDGSINFYRQLFQKSCSMSWPEVVQEASKYVEPLEKLSPRYLEEIRGIAEGANLPFLDVLALNVRTEINFGLFSDTSENLDVPSDGCTSLGWLTGSHSFLCQNWDWMVEQGPNLIICRISQPDKDIPDISMVTEAGIIGKIGFNSNGVGCCLNAIRCRGVDRSKLPIHFALRTVLESRSRAEAVEQIKSIGVAGSGHILVGDATGSTGLECTSSWVKELPMDGEGRICHTNHLLLDKSGVDEPPWLEDSPARLQRIQELASNMSIPGTGTIFDVFKDTEGYPSAINRRQEGGCKAETLFNIVMDLTNKSAQVTFGRPTEYSEQMTLAF